MTNILELLKNEKVKWKKLGEVCEIIRGVRITKKELLTKGYPVVSGGTGYMGYIDKYNREAETITIAQYGTAGYVNFQKERFWANDVCFSVIPYENVLNKYLYYFLVDKQEYLYEISNRTATPYSISKDKILSIEIPIPSIEIQKKIVETLDKFTNYVTELQSELKSRTKQYTYYRDKLLSEEYLIKVTKEMEEDRKLNIFKLDEIFDFKNGLNKGKEYFGKGVPFISYVNVYKLDRLQEEDIIEKVDLTEDEIARFSVAKGDVLFTRTSEVKEEVGYSSVVIDDLNNTVFNGFTIRGRLKNADLLIPEYSAHLFRCHEIRKEIIKRSSFTTRASLSGQELGKVKVVIPPLSLQNKIVKVLDKFQVLLADTKGLLPAEIEERQKQYVYYREKLLTFDVECSSTHARTSIISNNYYNILQEVANIVEVDIEDKVHLKVLSDISIEKLSYGSGAKAVAYDENIRYIRITDIDDNGQLKQEKVSPSIVEDKYMLRKGDILFARSGATVGKNYIHLVEEKAIYAGYLIKFTADTNEVLCKYVYHCVNNSEYEKFVSNMKSNASQPNINAQQYSNYKVIVPPLHVQQHVVSILDKFDILVNDIKEGLPKEIEQRQQQYEYWREFLLNFPR